MNRVLASPDERLSRWGSAVFAGLARYTNIVARPTLIIEVDAPRTDAGAAGAALSISDGLKSCARVRDVPAAIELYAKVRPEEAKAFFDELEVMLSSPNATERAFGVDLSVTLVLARIDPPWARRYGAADV